MKKELEAALKQAFPLVHKALGKKLDKMKDEEILTLLLTSLADEVKRLESVEISLKESQTLLSEGEENLKADQTALEKEAERLGPLAEVRPAGAEFDRKWLKDLTFRGRKEGKPKEKDGRKIKTFIPFDRDLEEGDILSWRDLGGSVVMVTAEGQKVTVLK